MMEVATKADFMARCASVAEAAHAAGLMLAKVPGTFAVSASRDGSTVSFPIVSDPHDWQETSPEEAFYCAVTDAFAWASARPGETAFVTLDAIERSEIPQIKRDLEQQMARLRALTGLVGGPEGVRRLWVAAGIDPDTVAAIDLA